MGVVATFPAIATTEFRYRGYRIEPTGYGGSFAFQYSPPDVLDSSKWGTAGTVQAAVEEIDDLEDQRPAARIVEDEPIMLRDLAAVLALSLFVVAVVIWLLAAARGQA